MLKLNNREKKTWDYSKFYFCGFNNNLYANKFYFTPIMQFKFMCIVYCYCSIWLNISYFYRELLLLNWCVADYIYCSDCCVFSPNWDHILLWLLLSKLSSWIRKFKHLVGREVIFISTVTQFYFNIFTQHSFLI